MSERPQIELDPNGVRSFESSFELNVEEVGHLRENLRREFDWNAQMVDRLRAIAEAEQARAVAQAARLRETAERYQPTTLTYQAIRDIASRLETPEGSVGVSFYGSPVLTVPEEIVPPTTPVYDGLSADRLRARWDTFRDGLVDGLGDSRDIINREYPRIELMTTRDVVIAIQRLSHAHALDLLERWLAANDAAFAEEKRTNLPARALDLR